MRKFLTRSIGVVAMLALAPASYAEKMLTGDEIKALISNKTVSVTHKNGTQWRTYFAPDGKSVRNNGDSSEWSVEDNKHCSSTAKLRCGAIRDNGNGTYSRLKPDGVQVVLWEKIVDGKDF